MIIEDFINKLEAEFDDLAPGSIKPATGFRDIEDWGSMHALIVIALVDTEYDITLSGADLRSVNTIQELFDLVKSK
jgi:acyl carrier protein